MAYPVNNFVDFAADDASNIECPQIIDLQVNSFAQ